MRHEQHNATANTKPLIGCLLPQGVDDRRAASGILHMLST